MARLTGFLVQALLVVLSFWLNVCHNTDVIRAGFPDIANVGETTVDETAVTSSSVNVGNSANEAQSLQEAGRVLNQKGEATETKETSTDDVPSEPEREAPAEQKIEANNSILVSAEFAREEETKIANSVSPNGGKIVSIPAYGVDALRNARNGKIRVLGVTPEELYQAPSQENTER